jgi:hypothetical protein
MKGSNARAAGCGSTFGPVTGVDLNGVDNGAARGGRRQRKESF